MTHYVHLQLDRVLVVFELNHHNLDLYKIKIRIKSEVDDCSFDLVSEQDSIAKSEIRRLISYFENHVWELENDPNHDSQVFVDQNLLMTFQALCGDVDDEGEGRFALQAMINPLPFSPDHARMYAGITTEVTIANTRRFLNTLAQVLSEVDK